MFKSFLFFKFFKQVLREGPAWMRHLFLFCPFFWSSLSWAFLSEILEAKKQVEGFSVALKSLTDTIEDFGGFEDKEKEYQDYKRDLREFQKTLDEYEKLGVDVEDFLELRNYNSNSLTGHVDFFKSYLKRTQSLLKNFQSLMGSPETITASEQIETNRTLRALLEDSQTRELRRLRKEIARERIKLERRKKEKEFINKQYAYINRHSKNKKFGVFYPFKNSREKENKLKKGERKKFLGIF